MYPDDLATRDWYDSILGKGKGDPDMYIKFIGEDKAQVEISSGDVHWSELPKPVNQFSPRIFGDNDKSSPEMNMEEE